MSERLCVVFNMSVPTCECMLSPSSLQTGWVLLGVQGSVRIVCCCCVEVDVFAYV